MNMTKMRFTILEEIKSTLPKSLFCNNYSQIKSNVGFLMRGEDRITRGKTSHGRVENQQSQSCVTGCGIRTRATLVEASISILEDISVTVAPPLEYSA